MAKYLVILNPTADRGKAATCEPAIHELFKKYELDYQLVLTQYIGHAIELTAKALADGVPYIIAGGGDGTANEVINGMILEKNATGRTAVLGVLPVGRGDDFAFSMGVPTESLEESVAAIAAGVTRKIDIGLATSDLYPKGRYFGNGVGTGFDAVVGFVAARNKVLRGFASYLWAALKTILLYYRAPQVKIELDHETLDLPAIMISTMNGIRLGGTFFIAPESQPGDGLLNICIVRQVSRPRMLQLLLSFMKGTQYEDPAVIAKKSRKVIITTENGALPTHMDGETLSVEGKQISIELFPQQIDIIVNPKGAA